jgi:hypothetical protein
LPYEKKFYAIFALFLAALIFIASGNGLLQTLPAIKIIWSKNKLSQDGF